MLFSQESIPALAAFAAQLVSPSLDGNVLFALFCHASVLALAVLFAVPAAAGRLYRLMISRAAVRTTAMLLLFFLLCAVLTADARHRRILHVKADGVSQSAAFAEVENCLIEYAKLTSQLPQYEASCAANKESAELSLRLHHEGMADFLSVAAAERAWLSSELNIISTRQNIRHKLAQLCTALGGGWPQPEKQK
jgi:hypothetical protein